MSGPISRRHLRKVSGLRYSAISANDTPLSRSPLTGPPCSGRLHCDRSHASIGSNSCPAGVGLLNHDSAILQRAGFSKASLVFGLADVSRSPRRS